MVIWNFPPKKTVMYKQWHLSQEPGLMWFFFFVIHMVLWWIYDRFSDCHQLPVRILQILEYGRAMKKARLEPHDFHGGLISQEKIHIHLENHLQHDLILQRPPKQCSAWPNADTSDPSGCRQRDLLELGCPVAVRVDGRQTVCYSL